MREDRSCASREGTASATFDQVATDTKQSGFVSDLEFVDRRLGQAYPSPGDLPVRVSPRGQRVCSPLADLAATIGVGRLARLTSQIDRMRNTHQEVLPRINAASACFGRDVALLYEPLEDGQIRQAASDEWATTLHDAVRADPEACASLLCEFESGPLPEHRTRIVETALGALDCVEPLASALWAEALADSGQDLRDYRITRNDFDLLKSRYLDIFELALHSLVFTARVANISRRGCAARHANGYKACLRQALDHSKTREREQWLIDFPAASQLYSRLKRNTRNDISHGRLRYDHRGSELIYGDGRRGSYLKFLIDYLHAVRLTHYLVDLLVVGSRASQNLCRLATQTSRSLR